MNKNQTHAAVMAALNSSGASYKVLNEQGGKPQHVRLFDGTDIWPSTATYCLDGKYNRKDLKGVVGLLESLLAPNNDPLDKRIEDLEEYVSYLELEIENIKSHLVI